MPTSRSSTSYPSGAAMAWERRALARAPSWPRGAHIDLNTSERDVAAGALYESARFTNREGGPNGPRMLYYGGGRSLPVGARLPD